MLNPVPPSASLIPPPPDLRFRLAVALQEVKLLRRLIRVAEDTPRQKENQVSPVLLTGAQRA